MLNEATFSLILIILLALYLQSGPNAGGSFLTDKQGECWCWTQFTIGDILELHRPVGEFDREGILIVDGLFTGEEVAEVREEVMRRVEQRPSDVRPEDLLNLHFNDSYLLSKSGYVISLAQNQMEADI